jgi:4-hydroxy-4-methyl-2-oxoglutarate aldolase
MDSSTPGNTGDTELYWEQLEQMATSRLPSMWIVKTTGSRPDHECVIGDGIAKTLYSVGCQGLVSDGRVRDIAGLLTTPFAAYCRGKAVHHVPLRFQIINQPVEVGGVIIHPGDVIHANSEGVIRIPSTTVANLAESAVRMRAFEHTVHKMLRRTDLSLSEKRSGIQNLIAEYGFADCITSPAR